MKNLLLGLLFILYSYAETSAQFTKGTHFVGATIEGSGNFSSSKFTEDTKFNERRNDLSLSLQWGIFTRDHFVAGVGIDGRTIPLRQVSHPDGNTHKILSTNYGIAPFVRWYKPVFNRLAFFVQPSLGAHWNRQSSIVGVEDKSFSASLMVKPGVSYRLGQRFALEADLNIFGMGLTYTTSDSQNSFRFASHMTSSLQSLFGLRGAFYLN
jgi:hypothetical protein